MKLAVIDCGTNTFNLLIVDLTTAGAYEKLFKTRFAVRLGEALMSKGLISESAFYRGLQAMSEIKNHLEEYSVTKVLAFATSAVRDTTNGNLFVAEVQKQFDIKIEVIDGNREAELIYYGIRGAVSLGTHTSLIMDIGGGSNEFILANKNKILWKQSFKIGAARVLERFKHSDPILENEIREINNYFEEELQSLFDAIKLFPTHELIGSSGAFESLVEMIHGELGGEPLTNEKTEYLLDLQLNKKISQMVFNSTVEARKNIKGLVPIRVDMIVVSCLMVNFILDKLDIKKLRVSTFSLKEGALLDYIDNLNK